MLLIDCSLAGISGDMLLAALIDLGASSQRIASQLESLPNCSDFCSRLTFNVQKVTRGGFVASHIILEHDSQRGSVTGLAMLEAYDRAAQYLGLSPVASSLGKRAIGTLVDAEAALHGETRNDVHLHEAGSVDTLCDILGACIALQELGVIPDCRILGTEVAVGGGSVTFSHGRVPVPPPATLEILRRTSYPFRGVDVDIELATPTGVALLTALVHNPVRVYPPMRAERVGYGAGNRDPAGFPNVLRVVEGELPEEKAAEDEVIVLETILDDASGEVLGYTLDRLLREGARDAYVVPAFGKKNRPAFLLQVICDEVKLDEITRILFEETATLGIRVNRSHRRLALRRITPLEVRILGNTFTVRIKVATDIDGRMLGFKPEYDDVAMIAKSTGRAFREIDEIVRHQAKQELGLA